MTRLKALKVRRRPAPAFVWSPHAFLGSNVLGSGDRSLFLYVAGGGGAWVAMAFEGPREGGAHAVLADHAHRLVGEFATSAAAQRAVEGFARQWLRGKKIEDCRCGEVVA